MTTQAAVPLEDELGDVLEKAMRGRSLAVEELAAAAGVAEGRIRDAIDYRPELTAEELQRLAAVLELNEVGLCALGSGRYPRPEIGALPFCVWPLRMPHGIGTANAYLVGECGADRAILFDTGAGIDALAAVWPKAIRRLDAVYLTHVEPEHAGGLCAVVARFDAARAYVPPEATAPCGTAVADGVRHRYGPLEVTAFATPGHAAAHTCYLVRRPSVAAAPGLLVAGDLLFAGSVGGPYFCADRLRASLRRVLDAVPAGTAIAPGHGPMTTVEHERRFNPFLG